ncbi:transmembrane protein 183 [Drosophila innubila]|uniref:transmembrane protein 183 n=1 Tax=Drosophila innubila TaxID=198719 RepID=UPI00148C94D1|nr:transmembrane protein 183 [Drosophila innubila]
MSLNDDSDEYIRQKLYRSRGKCAIYARQSDVYVELKPKSSANVRTPVAEMAERANSNDIDIDHDIWFHIAMHIDPEDVQTFALVCTQFARLVNSRGFWRNMYKRHCQSGTSKGWNLDLPAQLQLEQMRNCDTNKLRALVTEALFHCYVPLKTRLELGYSLDWLLQRTFVSCSQKKLQCLWIVCYTLRNQQSTHKQPNQMQSVNDIEDTEVVNDWEALAGDDVDAPARLTYNNANRHEGVVLLIVLCRQFMPLPLQLLYNQEQSMFRIKATREMLCTDMRAKNLELDFVDYNNSNNQLSVTVKYPRIDKYKVLPWWHPDFKRFFK